MISFQSREPILFTRKDASSHPEGWFLYAPSQILSVSCSEKSLSVNIDDFHLEGRQLIYIGREPIPCLNEGQLYPTEKTERSIAHYRDGIRYMHFSEGRYFHDLQLRFDYETEEGLIQSESGAMEALSSLADKLALGQAVQVVLLGDSISRGANSVESAPYIEQFCEQLRCESASPIVLHNLSKGGMDTAWGLTQARKAARLRPDLFILAFGMNDASAERSPSEYRANTQKILELVRNVKPELEVLLVSGMTANADWSLAFEALHHAYHAELLQLEDSKTRVVDILNPWLELVARKGFLSMTGNGVNHPNDFGHQIYSRALLHATLGGPSVALG